MSRNDNRPDPRSVSDVDRLIGKYVHARRLEIGISQERLAEAIGVTFQQVQKYEKGINRISASTLIAIARALDTNVSALIPKGEGRKSGVQESILEGQHFPELAAAFSRLNEDGRRLLIATARLFANEKQLQGPQDKRRD